MNSRDTSTADSTDLVIGLMREERQSTAPRSALSFLGWGSMVGEDSSPEREHKKPSNTASSPDPKPLAICQTQLCTLHGKVLARGTQWSSSLTGIPGSHRVSIRCLH